MTRYIAAGIVLLLFFVESTSANFTVLPESYTASEKLLIDLDEDDAHISGEFEFVFPNPEHITRRKTVLMPVWLPAHAQPDQTNLKTLFETVSFQGEERIALNKQSRSVLDQAIGLSVEANGHVLDYEDRLYTCEYGTMLRDGYYPKKYWRPGVNVVSFIAEVGSELIAEGKLRIDAKYRQPLIKTDGRTLLFYVPFFDSIFVRHYEEESYKYTITVKCPEGFTLVARSKLNYYESPTSTKLVIRPQDQQVILVELLKGDQHDTIPPLDTSWTAEPVFVEPAWLPPCECESRTNLNLQAIYWRRVDPIIQVNGRNYLFGDTVDGFKIVRISRSHIVFLCPEGHAVVLEGPNRAPLPVVKFGDESYSIGHTVNGYTILEIRKTEVVFRNPLGEKVVKYLYDYLGD